MAGKGASADEEDTIGRPRPVSNAHAESVEGILHALASGCEHCDARIRYVVLLLASF